MDRAQVHFEVWSRKRSGAGWGLQLATEDRAVALAAAQELMADGRAIAAKVTKETLDAETREFNSVAILNLGDPDLRKQKPARDDSEPLCVTPQDLYNIHARDRIGRLLEGFLERNRATPFELLHRPDLVETLETSGTELQHAIQKVAVPESQARGISVHELIRTFQKLVEGAIERLLKDQRRGAFPDIAAEGFAAAAERAARDPERHFLMGAAVSAAIAPATTWADKVSALLDLADQAPVAGPPRALALGVIEQLLAEILGSKPALDSLLGADLDLGARLAGMTRLAAPHAVEAVVKAQPAVGKCMPPLSNSAQRLARWLATEDFQAVRAALAKRVLRELNGPRRLRPSDAEGEIAILRALATALSAAASPVMPLEDVQAAFTARSKMLVTGDFVEAYLGSDRTARGEAEALVWLVENVIGAANKRQAARWVTAVVTALRFEKEMRLGPDGPATRLAALAALQRSIGRCGLAPEDYQPIQQRLGELGGHIETDNRLAATIGRAPAPALHRLTALLRLATGETAPLGPAADRAKAEATRLVKLEETRLEMARAPERLGSMRDLIQAAGIAA